MARRIEDAIRSQRSRVNAIRGAQAQDVAIMALLRGGVLLAEFIPNDWHVVRRERRIVSAYPKEKSGVDLHGMRRDGGRMVQCEVKWTDTPDDGLSWSAFKAHQIRRLDAVREYNGEALIAWVSVFEHQIEALVCRWPVPGFEPGAPLRVDVAREQYRAWSHSPPE